MHQYRFTVVADICPAQGLTEEELVLAVTERVVEVVEPRAVGGKVKGVQVEMIDHVVAMTLPQVVPPDFQDLIRSRQVRERRAASPVGEIDKG